jgi:hypothetical protein
MKILRGILFAVALICGIAAMGCWVLTQSDAAIPRGQGPLTTLIMSLSSVLFALLHATSAFLSDKGKGVRAIIFSTIYLMGVCGVLVVLFFVMTSVGRIFLFGPLPTVLLVVSIFSALLFRQKRIAPSA